jgi:hypothetical protein
LIDEIEKIFDVNIEMEDYEEIEIFNFTFFKNTKIPKKVYEKLNINTNIDRVCLLLELIEMLEAKNLKDSESEKVFEISFKIQNILICEYKKCINSIKEVSKKIFE